MNHDSDDDNKTKILMKIITIDYYHHYLFLKKLLEMLELKKNTNDYNN